MQWVNFLGDWLLAVIAMLLGVILVALGFMAITGNVRLRTVVLVLLVWGGVGGVLVLWLYTEGSESLNSAASLTFPSNETGSQ